MKILSRIKSHKFISIAIAVLLVVAVSSAVYANTRRSEEAKEAKVVNSTQVAPVSESKPLEKAEEVETPVTKESSSITPNAAQQYVQTTEDEPTPVQLTRNEVLTLGIETRESYQFNNAALQTRAVYNAVTMNYDKDPSLFTEDKAVDNIKKCYAYLDSVKPEVVSLNIVKGDCGL